MRIDHLPRTYYLKNGELEMVGKVYKGMQTWSIL